MKGVLGMANFRRTATGDAIYACLMQASVPLTAADVYESVRAQHPKLALTTVSVSYTHLDVYKRQVQPGAGRASVRRLRILRAGFACALNDRSNGRSIKHT